jgi:hypothetical protein
VVSGQLGLHALPVDAKMFRPSPEPTILRLPGKGGRPQRHHRVDVLHLERHTAEPGMCEVHRRIGVRNQMRQCGGRMAHQLQRIQTQSALEQARQQLGMSARQHGQRDPTGSHRKPGQDMPHPVQGLSIPRGKRDEQNTTAGAKGKEILRPPHHNRTQTSRILEKMLAAIGGRLKLFGGDLSQSISGKRSAQKQVVDRMFGHKKAGKTVDQMFVRHAVHLWGSVSEKSIRTRKTVGSHSLFRLMGWHHGKTMRSTVIFFLATLLLTAACRTENCPTGMERFENGLCADIETDEEFDTGALLDTGGEE